MPLVVSRSHSRLIRQYQVLVWFKDGKLFETFWHMEARFGLTAFAVAGVWMSGLAVSKALKLRLWQNWLAPVKLRWDARFFLGILARCRVYIGLGWCMNTGMIMDVIWNWTCEYICINIIKIIYIWSIMNVRQTQNDMKPYKLTGDNYTVRWNDMTFNVTCIAMK